MHNRKNFPYISQNALHSASKRKNSAYIPLTDYKTSYLEENESREINPVNINLKNEPQLSRIKKKEPHIDLLR
ncbi:hypothetical protein [Robertmurraya kyonggiensis]|uniref:Uncharacterized protein n=1 Tax=Robertmurraya kyonggiensis TaxID=1037680 RepID=A0A4V5P2M5_9BACI|nr:hypothetical protein [Robertmurraya kyonggiensis]TKC16850.1 hypothetical protein FA727_12340 [Robertmurraya kyonggiensis]